MTDLFKRLLKALGLAGGRNDGARDGAAGGAPVATSCGEDAEMLSCPEALERLFEYLDGELPEAAQSDVEAHLERCRRCYPRLQFERAFMETLRRARAGEQAPPELRRRVLDVLSEEGLELH